MSGSSSAKRNYRILQCSTELKTLYGDRESLKKVRCLAQVAGGGGQAFSQSAKIRDSTAEVNIPWESTVLGWKMNESAKPVYFSALRLAATSAVVTVIVIIISVYTSCPRSPYFVTEAIDIWRRNVRGSMYLDPAQPKPQNN